MACGTTHLFGLVTIWYPEYWLDAGFKLIAALVSAIAAFALWKLIPAALAMPSRTEVVIANEALTAEISRRMEAEANLKQANGALEGRTAELEAANSELDSFAYAVSHDLRAPLRAMSGFSQALLEDAGDKLGPDELNYLRHIGTASEEMRQLIDGLLTLSRHMRAELRHDAVDVSALAEEIRKEIGRTEPDRSISWNIEANLTAIGDRRLIAVVLMNLLTNACKYTGNTKVAEIVLSSHMEDGRLWFIVSDNGAGFDMAHADRLFKPFQRLHRQTEFPGIGIGLATVQRIVLRHGGLIRAEGVVGRGARFSFHIPPPSLGISQEPSP